MEPKTCPNCGGKLLLFYPNIPAFTGWYCVANCGTVLPATEEEIEQELAHRKQDDDQEEWEDDDEYEYDFDRHLNECGYDPEFVGRCRDIGTEWCSFHCPLHDMVFSGGLDDVTEEEIEQELARRKQDDDQEEW